MDSNRFNAVVVLDSIPDGELNTAKRLVEDLEVAAAAYPPTPAIAHVRIEGRDDLFRVLDDCRGRAEKDDLRPLIHFECHGDEDGFQLADSSFVDWAELKRPLTDLNIATGLNLMIVVAACSGGAIAKVVGITDRAPLWGLIGPTKPLSAQALQKAYIPFYQALFITKSPSEAVSALEASSEQQTFWRTTAQGLFETAWKMYRQRHCTPEQIELRATRMLKTAMSRGYGVTGLDAMKQALIDHEPESFRRYRANFFMSDIFPEHCSRFDVPYLKWDSTEGA